MDSLTLKTVVTGPCPRCKQVGTVEVPKSNYEKWISPPFPFIQDVLPMLSADLREQLMTGYHPECFALDFSEESDYEGECSTEVPF